MRTREIFAFFELPTKGQPAIRYYSDSPTFQALPRMIQEKVGLILVSRRITTSRVDPSTVLGLVQE